MCRRDGMPRLELISRHLASGAGCNARPLLLVTQEDFLSPPVCVGSTGTFRVPGVSPAQIEPHVAQPKMSEIPYLIGAPEEIRTPDPQIQQRPKASAMMGWTRALLREGTKRLMNMSNYLAQ